MPIEIEYNVESVKQRIERAAHAAGKSAGDIMLVAASKAQSAQTVRRAIKAGCAVCGENRVQEMLEKNRGGAYDGAELHFIGYLQKNKVRQVVGLCSLIHSVDSKELLEHINSRAAIAGVCQDVLIEVNIAGEQSKSGVAPDYLGQILDAAAALANIRVKGLMTIPPAPDKSGANRVYFARMYKLLVDISLKKYDNVSMDFLSMGMSGDFEDAILEGANCVRVGSAIFGERF